MYTRTRTRTSTRRTRQQEKIRLTNTAATLSKTYLIDVQNVAMGGISVPSTYQLQLWYLASVTIISQ